ncbi:MAG: TRAP transporter large permease [Kiritimatiellaeota bacterium]|nr:TRAP transporter large permease [Kiritimatiellota bacterium]
MDGTLIGIIGIGAMLVMILAAGMSPGFAMLLTGFVGILVMNPPETFAALCNGVAGPELWGTFSEYGFTVIPLFILLGEVIFNAGYSDRLFHAAKVWCGHKRGGLAATTIIAAAGFSSICGSNTATAATMSAVALPPMTKAGYHPELKTGAIAAGSTLGAMIPPSIVLVVYGIHTGLSIGKLFAGSIIPGLLLTFALIASVGITTRRHPDWAPPSPRGSWRERLLVLKDVADVLSLFAIVMFAMFSGVVSPTESAGFGALIATALCFARGRLTRAAFIKSIRSTLRVSAMVFLILAGAKVFGKFLVLTQIPFMLAENIAASNLAPHAVLMLVIVCYLAGGMFMDALAFLLVTLPLFQPLVVKLGFDLIWFGQVVCLVTTLGAITPPIGTSCFVVAGMCPDATSAQVTRGSMRFVPAYAIVFVLLLLFPNQTVMWFANLVK